MMFGPEPIRRKLVIVGDSGNGKTTLLRKFFYHRSFSEIQNYRDCDDYFADIEIDNKQIELAMWDTPAHSDYDRLRPLSYPGAHVILITFSFDKPDSLDNAQDKWIKEVSHYALGVPIILVGCKKDMVEVDSKSKVVVHGAERAGRRTVTSDEGIAVAQKLGAKYYAECSSKTCEGVDEVFQLATRAALLVKVKDKGRKGLGCLVV